MTGFFVFIWRLLVFVLILVLISAAVDGTQQYFRRAEAREKAAEKAEKDRLTLERGVHFLPLRLAWSKTSEMVVTNALAEGYSVTLRNSKDGILIMEFSR